MKKDSSEGEKKTKTIKQRKNKNIKNRTTPSDDLEKVVWKEKLQFHTFHAFSMTKWFSFFVIFNGDDDVWSMCYELRLVFIVCVCVCVWVSTMERMIGQHDNIGDTRKIFNENIEQENFIII